MCVQTLVSCNEANTSASIIETDEGVGTEDQSQLTVPSSHQACLHSNADHHMQLHMSSVYQELLRKSEQLKFLRQMLKEVYTACIVIKQCTELMKCLSSL